MRQIDINIPRIDDVEHVIGRIESVFSSYGLLMHSKSTLRGWPGCIHWHYRRGQESGTLEVTLWPAKRRAWFKVQASRNAPWIDQLIPALKAELEKG